MNQINQSILMASRLQTTHLYWENHNFLVSLFQFGHCNSAMFPTHLTINNHQTPSEAQAHDVPHRHWQHPPRTWWPASHNFIVESTEFHVFFSSRNSMSVPNARCGRTLKVWFWVRTKVNEKESEFQLELNPTAFYKHTRWQCTHILPSLRLASTLKQALTNFIKFLFLLADGNFILTFGSQSNQLQDTPTRKP